jgi:hypothetical protein
MANITRIKNNQVTDNTIEYQKIKDGTLVGSKFNANLTLNSNVTILGNLTVANSFAQLNSINTYINDPVVVFNNNYTGSPTYDIGMLINRNLNSLAPYGAVNAAFVWKEASNAFVGIMTTETGTTAGAINNSGFANLIVGNITANSMTMSTGSITAPGGIQNTPIGNTTASTGRFTTIVSTGTTTSAGNLVANSGTASTTTTTGALVVVGGVGISGAVNTGSTLAVAGIATISGNVVAASGTASTSTTTGALVVTGGAGIGGAVNTGSTLTVAGIATINGNVVANSGTASTSATTGALVIAGSGGLGVGGAIYNSGVLVSGGNIVAASGTASTNTTTGALVVTGGAGISGALNVGGTSSHTGASTFASTLTASGNIVASSGTASTNTTTGALVVVGGIGASGAIYAGSVQNTPVGSSTPNTGAFTTLTASGLTTVTNTTQSTTALDGALIVSGGTGIAKNLNVGGNVVITGNLTVNGQQTIIGTTDLAITDAVINLHTYANLAPLTSNDGKDIGVKFHYYDYQDEHAFLGLSQDLYLEWYDSGREGVGNVFTGNTYGRIKAGEFWAANTTVATSTTTGALRVSGGAGIAGDVYAGSIQNTPIGNATASTGRFTTVTTTGILTSAGNIVANSGTASTSTTTGAIVTTGGLGVAGAIYNGGIHVSLGNIVAASGTASTNTTSGALVVTGGIGASGAIYAGSIQNTPIGSTTASTGAFTTITSSGTTIASGNLVAAATTDSTNTTTGALVVKGGAGIASNVIVGGNIVAASTQQAFGTNQGALVTVGGAAIGNGLHVTGVTRLFGNAVMTNFQEATVGNLSSGTFLVQGGTSIWSNLNVGGGAVFNTNMTAGFDTITKGNFDETLIWARAGTAYDQVLIGNSATTSTLVRGAKLIVNSTDSMIVPTGTNAQRPSSSGGTDVTGMFRYNTTVSALEVYDGTEWDAITTQFTVIVAEQFAGDDSTTVFTMSGASTTAATIVSINGVIQIPTSAYSVSETTLTFTEAPATGDVIDVRRLATTSVVSGLASVNGYMQVLVDNNGVYVYTGTSSTNVTTYWNPQGAQVEASANVTASTANVLTGVDSFFSNTYRSAIYQAQVTSGTDYQVQTVTVIHDGTTATAVTHGVIQTNGNLGVFDANVSGGRVYLNFIPSTSNDVLRLKKDYLLI